MTITPGTGIRNIEASTEIVMLTAQQNGVTLQFAESGVYQVSIVNAAGQRVCSKSLQVRAGEGIVLQFNSPQGTYVLDVRQNGRLLKALKLLKR